VYICKFRVLFLSSGIGDFVEVISDGPVGGVYGKPKPHQAGCRVGEKCKIYKNENKKCILYTIQGI
jgi:hypothetical protein